MACMYGKTKAASEADDFSDYWPWQWDSEADDVSSV